MAPTFEIIDFRSSDEDNKVVVSYDDDDDDDDDDDCVILDGDPDKQADKVVNYSPEESDEVAIVAEKGQIACRDYPHARHLCAIFPFNINPHEKCCDLCHCYVCDIQAPCIYWGTGKFDDDHCHSTDKKEIWRVLRQCSKEGKLKQSTVSTLHPELSHPQPLSGDEEREVLLNLSFLALDQPAMQADRLTGTVKWFNRKKGYGFITRDNGDGDLFFHESSIKSGGGLSRNPGKLVEFQIESGDDGRYKAIDVTCRSGSFIRQTTSNCNITSRYSMCRGRGHTAINGSWTGSSNNVNECNVSDTSERSSCRGSSECQADKLTGTVKWYNHAKGYGFITRDNGDGDLFVHRSNLKSAYYLVEGEVVEFRITKGADGRNKAIDVCGPSGSLTFVSSDIGDTFECRAES